MAKSSKGTKKAAAKKPAPARRRTAGAKSSKKKAAKKAPARAAARKGPARKAAKKAVKAAARRVVARKAAPKKTAARKAAPKKAAAKKVAPPKKALPRKAAKPVATKKAAATKPVVRKAAAPAPKPIAAQKAATKSPRPAPGLNRERRTVRETPPPSAPSTLGAHRHASAAASGADELRVKLASHTGDGPALTAGDVDANWEAAESVGDEAPGGDNPTPDQDVVDDIGRALGVEYDDDEELQGGDEIAARDHNRWELDPASSDDFDER